MSMTIYSGGSIVTMEEPLYAEAVLVEDGVIRATGARETLLQSCPPGTEEAVSYTHLTLPTNREV